jgi:chemotaxis protein CheZ
MTTKLSLMERIALLEQTQHGDLIPATEVWKLLDSVKEMFGEKVDGVHGHSSDLYRELGELAKFINSAKKELQEVRASNIADEHLPNANNHLDAIAQMTEQATGRIMDECDQITNFHNDAKERLLAADPAIDPNILIGVDDALNQAQTSVTHIYEACNFQDITVQRIQKVIKALQEIERQVLRMVVVFGLLENQSKLDEATKQELTEDAVLLQGPQLAGQGLEQDDIDAILAKLL